MIVRTWRGRAAPSNPQAYADHFRRNVAPELAGIEGYLGAELVRQRRQDDIEYLVLTRWESMQAVRAFAGDDVDKAVIEPGAVAALVSYDERVQHYEVVDEVAPRGPAHGPDTGTDA